MNRQPESSTNKVATSLLVRGGLALLVLLAWFIATANAQVQPETSAASPSMHVKHVLGFEGVKRNASGELSVQDDRVRFQRDGSPAAEVAIASIRNISLGTEDSQVGGVPMMLGKTAVPFGGGRVVSLLAHKKYDSLAIEYLDSNGGFHGSIFLLTKGQGEAIKSDLIASGAKIAPFEDPGPVRTTPEESVKAAEEWSVQVDSIDAGATKLDTSFSDAIYENMLVELTKSKQFTHVFRSGDRDANGASGVLVLKTRVEKYNPGSETQRAVTTIAGATKLKVRIQLVTRDGHVLLEHVAAGNVRFLGDNLRATHNLAHNAAKILKRSPLPHPATSIAQSNEKEPIP